jgi:hypothetical protein
LVAWLPRFSQNQSARPQLPDHVRKISKIDTISQFLDNVVIGIGVPTKKVGPIEAPEPSQPPLQLWQGGQLGPRQTQCFSIAFKLCMNVYHYNSFETASNITMTGPWIDIIGLKYAC